MSWRLDDTTLEPRRRGLEVQKGLDDKRVLFCFVMAFSEVDGLHDPVWVDRTIIFKEFVVVV